MSLNRPPIVVVLGHVDHGKTTLLDAIRETDIAKREAGGITQKIGASVVTTKEGKKITFIDTPGHAAFSKMRSRGANVADIAILVVACDDGFKPQTKEALGYILDAKIPYIVAATKTDLPSASIDLVKNDLEKNGVQLEGLGGDVPVVAVSARNKQGLDELLETISLVSEMNRIGETIHNDTEAVIIETGLDKRGALASVVLRGGTINVGDEIVSEAQIAKVRGLFDDRGCQIRSVSEGFPALILGFEKVPVVGSIVRAKGNGAGLSNLGINKELPRKAPKDEISVIIKAQTTGSLEAILSNIPPKIFVVDFGVGDIKESDIFMAKSTNSMIFVFESKVASNVQKLADNDGVKICEFKIIYELFEKMQDMVAGNQEEVLGKAEILATFPYENKKVAGCKVLSGKIKKSDNLVIARGIKRLGNIKVISMKKDKKDVFEVGQGEEFGLLFEPQLDFSVGDMILSISK